MVLFIVDPVLVWGPSGEGLVTEESGSSPLLRFFSQVLHYEGSGTLSPVMGKSPLIFVSGVSKEI